jgi:4-hydroxy-tetrahydrodipicolinate synthase
VTNDTVLSLYNANTPTALQSLRDGAAGLSPIGANFYPELYSYLYRHARKEETQAFTKISQFISLNDPLIHALYPFSAKWFLQQRGLPISVHTRTPLPKAHKEELIRLHELLATMEELFDILRE